MREDLAMNAQRFGTAAHDLAERPGRLLDGSLMAGGWGVGIVGSAYEDPRGVLYPGPPGPYTAPLAGFVA